MRSAARPRAEMWGRLPTFFCLYGLPRRGVNQTLEVVVSEVLDSLGFDLVELRKGGTRERPLVEVRIDRRDGVAVAVDDCARVSRALEDRLDAGGVVAERYVLQVSSPGDRPLRTPDEWRRFTGRWISVLAPEHGGRFEARLVGLEGGAGENAVLEVNDTQRHIPLSAIKEARLAFRI